MSGIRGLIPGCPIGGIGGGGTMPNICGCCGIPCIIPGGGLGGNDISSIQTVDTTSLLRLFVVLKKNSKFGTF